MNRTVSHFRNLEIKVFTLAFCFLTLSFFYSISLLLISNSSKIQNSADYNVDTYTDKKN